MPDLLPEYSLSVNDCKYISPFEGENPVTPLLSEEFYLVMYFPPSA